MPERKCRGCHQASCRCKNFPAGPLVMRFSKILPAAADGDPEALAEAKHIIPDVTREAVLRRKAARENDVAGWAEFLQRTE